MTPVGVVSGAWVGCAVFAGAVVVEVDWVVGIDEADVGAGLATLWCAGALVKLVVRSSRGLSANVGWWVDLES